MIGLTVPLLQLLSGKSFGISSSLQHIGAACTPNAPFDTIRNHDWRRGAWNLIFVAGIVIGSFFAVNFFSSAPVQFLPESSYTIGGGLRLLIGGVFVGFGTRYAGGCTSGHAITGLSNLNWPSLVATVFFFVGGLIVTWGLGNIIF